MPSFSTSLEKSIHSAISLANEKKHEFATLEHLLLALINEKDARRVLEACNVDIKVLTEKLKARRTETPYSKYGNYLNYIFIIFGAVVLARKFIRPAD